MAHSTGEVLRRGDCTSITHNSDTLSTGSHPGRKLGSGSGESQGDGFANGDVVCSVRNLAKVYTIACIPVALWFFGFS